MIHTPLGFIPWPRDNMIYLIEKAWSDSTENESCAAFGYAPFSYVESEDEAKSICSKSRILDKSFCWAVFGPCPELRYRPIPRYTPE